MKGSTDSNVLVSCEGVGKKFAKDLKKSLWYGVKDVARDVFNPFSSPSRTLREKEFFAVEDVSFELKRGECLGIIGRNGAGKTTVLKLISGLIKPDFGKITNQGRIGALIAVGAGFNPVLSGRENVFANGAVLGLSRREIKERFDSIVDFSGIEEFIDSPVRTYSSGMQVRLGMAIAAHIQPDIMLLDEILAVGDVNFQQKCLKVASTQIEETGGEKGPSGVILVSHNMESITRYCNKLIVLDKGKVVFTGGTSEGIKEYLRLNTSELDVSDRNSSDRASRCSLDTEFTRFESVNESGEKQWERTAFEPIVFEFSCRVNRPVDSLQFSVLLKDALTEKILTNTILAVSESPLNEGEERHARCVIEPGAVRPGMYSVYAILKNSDSTKAFDVLDQNVDLPFLTILSDGVEPHYLQGYFNIDARLEESDSAGVAVRTSSGLNS